MLIVLMIISVLLILIIPNIGNKSEAVSKKGCNALVTVVQAQVDTYFLDNGNHPTDLDELVSNEYITDEQKYCQGNQELLYVDGKVFLPEGE
ncbi:competence type IV pilus major pilin ComGC [Ornithinibacillus salinisoli]|uniref:ComG operon protein 3 n=2 Tax=Ornithinibacillus salinisoli TaxID=1848459 RepID=A0ABW4W4L4_9BACI